MNEHEISSLLSSIDSVSFADIIDALEKREGEIEFFSEDSGLLFHHDSGLYYIAETGSGKEILERIPEKCLASVHGERIYSYMVEKYGYEKVEPTYLYLYEGRTLPVSVAVKTLDSSYVPFIATHYDVSSEEDISFAALNNHLFGAFSEDGDMMAFAGFHREGSMGMLTVFPDYRRKGLGFELEKHLINTALEEGRRAYCNVFFSNTASIALQEKLGLSRGPVFSWWTWKE